MDYVLAVLAVVFYHTEIEAGRICKWWISRRHLLVISGYLIANLIISICIVLPSLTEFFFAEGFLIAPALLLMMHCLSCFVLFYYRQSENFTNRRLSLVHFYQIFISFFPWFNMTPIEFYVDEQTWSLSVKAQFDLPVQLFVLFGFQTNFKKFSIVVILILAALCAPVFGVKMRK